MMSATSFAAAAAELADREKGQDSSPGRTWKSDASAGSSSGDVEISAGQKMLAACSGSLLTSLLVTPLDVVRVRLQSQHPSPTASSIDRLPTTLQTTRLPISPLQFQSSVSHLSTQSPALGVTACCREVFWLTNPAESCLAATPPPPPPPPPSSPCIISHRATTSHISGTFSGLAKIARTEGLSSLYRGLFPTLLMAIPSNVIYFTGYDTLRTADWSPFSHSHIGALLAGSAARAISATVISPVEMFKTRLQASASAGAGAGGVWRSTLRDFGTMVEKAGVRSLWRGLELTLWRDVPFSGVYWLGYESGRAFLRREREKEWRMASLPFHHGGGRGRRRVEEEEGGHEDKTLTDSFIAGAASGCVAAFLTTPFDVGKTRRQVGRGVNVGDTGAGMLKVLCGIWKNEGVAGLWRGCVPRMLKVAPACAIMISSYEVGKKAARKMNMNRRGEVPGA